MCLCSGDIEARGIASTYCWHPLGLHSLAAVRVVVGCGYAVVGEVPTSRQLGPQTVGEAPVLSHLKKKKEKGVCGGAGTHIAPIGHTRLIR